jgi:peptidoglycan/LPS O-acetylase OafA/YrhL
MQNSNLLKSKQHYEVLDGLRGVAALVVVTFHFMEMAIFDYSKNFVGHGFLAVDFFFCLSGFVIAYAYDNRIGQMGIAEFFKSRLIRLHPLVVLGSVLGLITFLIDPFFPPPVAYTAGRIALIFILSILMIPNPMMQERTYNLFTFNAPAWSLFWEYVANIVYATVLWRLNKRILLIIALLAAAALAYVGYTAGNVMGGWGKDTFWHGFARVSFSFTAGMVVYRYHGIIKNKLGFGGMSILLLAALLMPYFKLNWLAELLVVTIWFPLLIALGAGAQPGKYARRLCKFSGNLSYPLYMTHYAVIWVFSNYFNKYKPALVPNVALIIIIALPILIGFAWLAMVLYDIPVRRYLSKVRSKNL